MAISKGDELELTGEDELDIQLLNVIEGLGGQKDTEVRVYRSGPNRQHSFLFTTTPEEFSIDSIRAKWGGGEFRIHARQDGQLVANRKLIIEPEPEQKIVPINNQSDSLIEFMQMSMEKQNESMATMTNLMIAMMTKAMTPPVPVPIPVPAPVINPIDMQRSMMEMMVAMKTLTAEPKSGDGHDGIEAMMKGIELARDLNAGEKEASSTDVLLEAIKTFGGPLAEIAAGGTSPAITPSISNQPVKRDENMWWKTQLKMLIMQARAKKDPFLYANLIFDQTPIEKIKEFLSVGNPIEALVQVNAEIGQFRPWFNELLTGVQELLNEVEPVPENEPLTEGENSEHNSADAVTGEVVIDPESISSRSGGNKSDVTGNADVGKEVQNGHPDKGTSS